jgi:hypothetical protein
VNKIINIKKDIEKVNKIIDKRRILLEEHPEDKRLRLVLQSFEGRKDVLYQELEYEYNKLIDKAKNALENNNNIIESLIAIREK